MQTSPQDNTFFMTKVTDHPTRYEETAVIISFLR